MNTLRIFLFGPFEVLRDNQPLEGAGWRSRQTRTIFKFLLAQRGRVVLSEQLIDLLWAGMDVDAARRALHVRISQLRRALGSEPYILTESGGYSFNLEADYWIDADVFSQQVERGQRALENDDLVEAITAYETARALYRGDFLEEDLYEAWTAGEREQLRERHLTALTELAECYAHQGRYRRAIDLCEQILLHDPWREAVYVHLMAYHYHAGERAQALRTYARCRQMLADEIGVAPLASTVRLARQIRDGKVAAVGAAPYPPPAFAGRLFAVPYSLGNPPLVGREREYAWLVERWRHPHVRLLALAGEAGIGKSRLAVEFLGYVSVEGGTVLQASAGSQPGLPYAPIVAALHGWRRQWQGAKLDESTRALLSPLFPEMDVAEPALAGSEARLRAALQRLIEGELPADALLFIDNAHHLDPPSLRLLAQLCDHLTILLAYRSEEIPPDDPLWQPLLPLRREQRMATLHLQALGEEAVQALTDALAQDALPETVTRMLRRGNGVPLYIIATLQHLFEEGALYVAPSGRWAGTGTLPQELAPGVRQVIQTRLQRLRGTARQLFDVAGVIAAVGASDFDFDLLRKAGDFHEPALLEAVDQLLEAHLLLEPRAPGWQELQLAHDYYGEVAYQAIPALRRAHLHRRVATALAATATTPALAPALAAHYEAGGRHDRAFDWWVRAGDAAYTRHATEEALAFYQRAAALGNGESAFVWEQIGRLYRRHLARYEAGIEAYQEAINRRLARKETRAAIHAYCALAECYRETSQYEAAALQAQRALDLARPLPQNEALLARGHITLSSALRSGQLAGMDVVRDHLERARELAKAAEAWHYVGEASFWLGVVLVNSGDPLSALPYDREALSFFRRSGRADWESIALNNLADHALQAGQVPPALEAAQEGLGLAQRLGTVNTEMWLLHTLGRIQICVGRLDDATETLQQALALVARNGPRRLRPGLYKALADIALAEGRYSAARNLMEEILPEAQATAPQYIAWLEVTLAHAFLGMGDCRQAMAHAQTAQEIAAGKNQAHVEGQAWRLLAQTHAARGEDAAAGAAFQRSMSLLRGSGAVVERARTEMAYGHWRRQRGDEAEGVALLGAARDTFRNGGLLLDLAALDNLPPL